MPATKRKSRREVARTRAGAPAKIGKSVPGAVALYTGRDLEYGVCLVRGCRYTITATDHAGAQAGIAAHRREVH